jgi:hypothetical protein
MRQYERDVLARIPRQKPKPQEIVASLNYDYVEQLINLPVRAIEITVSMRGRFEEADFPDAAELAKWLSAKILTGRVDIPLKLKSAKVGLGSLVLLCDHTEAAAEAIQRRCGLKLIFTPEGQAPIEHRLGRNRPKRRR